MRFFCVLLAGLVLFPPSASHAVAPVCEMEMQRGTASWYGPGFAGRMTKNEEVYDPRHYSAAHKSLPFGTIVKVTSLRNSKSVFVRINDRGPHAKNRIIDLSEAAARQIGMIDSGVAKVAIYECDTPSFSRKNIPNR